MGFMYVSARVTNGGLGSTCVGGGVCLQGEGPCTSVGSQRPGRQGGRPEVPFCCCCCCCCWFPALFGPLNPCLTSPCMLRVLEQIPLPAWPPEAPPPLPTAPTTHGPLHIQPAPPPPTASSLSFSLQIPVDANPPPPTPPLVWAGSGSPRYCHAHLTEEKAEMQKKATVGSCSPASTPGIPDQD